MKYMHFNSACSYAGLANQLDMAGINTEDTEIVKKIGLPYCIEYQEQDKCYLTGAMLQGKKWFDLYLSDYGKEYQEVFVPSHKLLSELKTGMMLGIQIAPGRKHAVIFLGKTKEGSYQFLNNKWEASEEPENLFFSEQELLQRVPEEIILGCLKDGISKTEPVINRPKIPSVWKKYLEAITAYASKRHSAEELRESRNPLFRPLLVDMLAMMQIMEDEKMIKILQKLQKQYIEAINKKQDLLLAEELDLQLLRQAVECLRNASKNL